MERIKFDQLGFLGKMNYLKVPTDWGFLESGYFHVDDGDHHFYYRYVINGEIWEMLEDDGHRLYKMNPSERASYLMAYL